MTRRRLRACAARARHMPDDDRGRGARDAGKIMMFRQPVAMIPPRFRMAREIDRVPEGNTGIAALDNWREIENGVEGHVRGTLELIEQLFQILSR